MKYSRTLWLPILALWLLGTTVAIADSAPTVKINDKVTGTGDVAELHSAVRVHYTG